MPNGGKLVLQTENVDLDETITQWHLNVTPGVYVNLSMTDSGSGMDAETQARIFEPFFTTKGHGGTGLGLSTVYGIVQQSGGTILVYSELGHGTTFKVYLPRVDQAAERADRAAAITPPRGSETILVVEDEDAVRNLIASVLQKQGYTLLLAKNGGEALVVSERHPGTINLMVTDVVMPSMGGSELAIRLKPLRPDTKVLFMSGYTDSGIVHHGILNPNTAFIEKPFALAALARKVRDTLDAQTS
jgi:CheY-like chemotaxis protein